MVILKAIIVFFLMFLAIGKILKLFENQLEIQYEILYIIEIILCIAGTIIIFKI